MESDEEAGSGGSTPVQDEHHYNSDREEPMSVDQPTSPSRGKRRGGEKGDARDIDRNDGDMKEVMSGAEDSDNEREKGDESDDDRPVASPVSGPQSPDANSQDGPKSPVSEMGSPQGPQSPDQDSQDREGGPQSPGQESRSGPQSPDQQVRSHSASPEQRSRSGSRSPSNRSRSKSPSNRSRSPSQRSRSGSPQRSRSGSPQRSRSGSPVQRSRSRSGSADQRSRSRSGSPGQRSRSGSPQRSRSGSPQRSRSRSGSPGQRSGSGSPAHRSRSASGSPSRKSRSRSRSGSPGERSGSGSADRRSRSGSRSPSHRSKAGSKSPESQTAEDDERKKKSGRDSPHSDEDSDTEQPAGESAPAKDYSDDEDESDKESAVGGLIADIFGSSDEDEEFEGFGVADVEAPVKKKEKKKTAVVSDDDEDEDDEGAPEGGDTQEQEQGAEAGVMPTQGGEGEGDAAQAGSDDDMMKEDFVSDFEVMMHRKKEENQKYKRKRRDVDIINDNDDLIADMINKMKTAAEEDRIANENKKAATKKIKYLPAVRSQLKKADLHVAFLDCGILSAITEWLAPLPDRSLPHIQIRETMLKFLGEFPPVGADTLKASGIGKAVMYIYKHPKETRENKERAGKLINEWSRPIFNLTSNFKMLSREERQQRDYDQLPKRRRLSSDGSQTPRRDIDKALAGEDKALRPGDPGWIYRARVPNPSHKDYVVRPRWNVEEMSLKGASKKQVTRYEKHIRAFQEKKKGSKNQRAVTISIEGRNMSL